MMKSANLITYHRAGLAFVLAALLSASVQAGQVFTTDFTGGVLGSEWDSTSSTHSNGVVKIAERGGRSHVLSMNVKGNGSDISTVNLATMSFNITGKEDIKLGFDHFAEQDPVRPFLPGVFQGIPEATGVAISSNGTDWLPLWSPELTHVNGWVSIKNLDISALIAANPTLLSSTGLLKIRFQHYMEVKTGLLRSDGRAWDQISLSFSPVPEPSTGLLLALGAASAMGWRVRRRTPQ